MYNLQKLHSGLGLNDINLLVFTIFIFILPI